MHLAHGQNWPERPAPSRSGPGQRSAKVIDRATLRRVRHDLATVSRRVLRCRAGPTNEGDECREVSGGGSGDSGGCGDTEMPKRPAKAKVDNGNLPRSVWRERNSSPLSSSIHRLRSLIREHRYLRARAGRCWRLCQRASRAPSAETRQRVGLGAAGGAARLAGLGGDGRDMGIPHVRLVSVQVRPSSCAAPQAAGTGCRDARSIACDPLYVKQQGAALVSSWMASMRYASMRYVAKVCRVAATVAADMAERA